MKQEHRLAKLLRQAADDVNARFSYLEFGNGLSNSNATIKDVLNNPNHVWKLVKPSKWQAEKSAYAYDVTVQYKYKDADADAWRDIPLNTIVEWEDSECEFRIKPKTVTKWLWCRGCEVSNHLMSEEEQKKFPAFNFKLNWSATEVEVKE